MFNNDNITTVISLIESPFIINENIFNDNTFNVATLYVPEGTIEKYKETSGWNNFVNIEEGNGITSNISSIVGKNVKTNCYGLDGKMITSPHSGIGIIKLANGKTIKALMND